MSQGYSAEIANAIKSAFENDDLHFSFDSQKGVFRFGMRIEGQVKHLDYRYLVHENDYTVYATPDVNADMSGGLGLAKVMLPMAEFICRANYGLKHGNFEFDCRDGEIRYKLSVNCDDAVPTEKTVKRSLIIPSMMVERYAPGILDVIFKGRNVEEAIDDCENDRYSQEGEDEDLPHPKGSSDSSNGQNKEDKNNGNSGASGIPESIRKLLGID